MSERASARASVRATAQQPQQKLTRENFAASLRALQLAAGWDRSIQHLDRKYYSKAHALKVTALLEAVEALGGCSASSLASALGPANKLVEKLRGLLELEDGVMVQHTGFSGGSSFGIHAPPYYRELSIFEMWARIAEDGYRANEPTEPPIKKPKPLPASPEREALAHALQAYLAGVGDADGRLLFLLALPHEGIKNVFTCRACYASCFIACFEVLGLTARDDGVSPYICPPCHAASEPPIASKLVRVAGKAYIEQIDCLLRACTNTTRAAAAGVALYAGANAPSRDNAFTIDEKHYITRKELERELDCVDATTRSYTGVKGAGNAAATGKALVAAALNEKAPVYVHVQLMMDWNKRATSKIWSAVCERRVGEWGQEDNLLADCGITLERSTLMLVGGKGTSTAFHVDWSQAKNGAVAIVNKEGEYDKDLVLARWTLIHPSAAKEACKWMQKQFKPSGGKAAWTSAALSPAHVAELTAHLQANHIVVLEQRAGDIIHVAPGWAHQVENMAPCLKVAWDCVEPENLPLYVEVMRSIRAHIKFTSKDREDTGGDYLNLSSIMMRAATSGHH